MNEPSREESRAYSASIFETKKAEQVGIKPSQYRPDWVNKMIEETPAYPPAFSSLMDIARVQEQMRSLGQQVEDSNLENIALREFIAHWQTRSDIPFAQAAASILQLTTKELADRLKQPQKEMTEKL